MNSKIVSLSIKFRLKKVRGEVFLYKLENNFTSPPHVIHTNDFSTLFRSVEYKIQNYESTERF